MGFKIRHRSLEEYKTEMKLSPYPKAWLLIGVMLLQSTDVFAATDATKTNNEPTNAAEAVMAAAAKKAQREAIFDQRYQALVAKLPPEEQAWEKVLQDNLGGFYLSHHKEDKTKGLSTAWDFVKDDPKLPRVLIIGDSVSRGYTQATRKYLAGKANVHRAPANCGPTAAGVAKLDIWLGNGHWDVIHFNFGIHDRNTPTADYAKRLEAITQRLQATGAKIIWASSTPIPDDASKQQIAALIVERNQVALGIMRANGVVVDDLYEKILPELAKYQRPNDVHFTDEGYDFLGVKVSTCIEAAL
jgi:hypothetical protein